MRIQASERPRGQKNFWDLILQVYRVGIALRPSTLTGKMYPNISRSYFKAVHAVLTHKKAAEMAAAELQRELIHSP